mgnify:CR=1 FL=1
MAINVKLVTNKPNPIKFATNNTPIIIRTGTVGGGTAAPTKLVSLTDVDAANTANGNILVYNNSTSTFVLGPIDGGEF